MSFRQGGHARHTVQGFNAGPGYDLASGVGTVNAAYFVYELAGVTGPPTWASREAATSEPS